MRRWTHSFWSVRLETLAALTTEFPGRMRDGVAALVRAFDHAGTRVLRLGIQNRRVGDLGLRGDTSAAFSCHWICGDEISSEVNSDYHTTKV